MLTSDEIRTILELLRPKTLTIRIAGQEARVVDLKGDFGYAEDPKISGLQAKLSIMLEVAARRDA